MGQVKHHSLQLKATDHAAEIDELGVRTCLNVGMVVFNNHEG